MSLRQPEHIYTFLRSAKLPYWILYKKEPLSGSSAFQEYWRHGKAEAKADRSANPDPEAQMEESIQELANVIGLYEGAEPNKVLFKIEAAKIYNSKTADRQGNIVFMAPRGEDPPAQAQQNQGLGTMETAQGLGGMMQYLGMRDQLYSEIQEKREVLTEKRQKDLQEHHIQLLELQNKRHQLDLDKKAWEAEKKRQEEELKRERETELEGVEKWDKILQRVDGSMKTIGNYVIAFNNKDASQGMLAGTTQEEEPLSPEEEVVAEINDILLDTYSLDELKDLLKLMQHGKIQPHTPKEITAESGDG
ncbi:MAG: hypothetical protein AAF135_09525 [Bacteroidota bacterium]